MSSDADCTTFADRIFGGHILFQELGEHMIELWTLLVVMCVSGVGGPRIVAASCVSVVGCDSAVAP